MGAEPPGPLAAGLSPEDLAAEVATALRELGPGAAAVVAVSGGPDSVAMLHLTARARPDLHLVVGHVRHGLRDDQADADSAAAHAGTLGLSYAEEPARVSLQGQGPEAAARRGRYEALSRIAGRAGADTVLVGHSADDQAETVLLNLVRGAGLPGLAGMRRVRAHGPLRIVRPLLRVRRADLRAFLEDERLAAVEDPTNADLLQRRARARHDVLPTLRALGGDPVGALCRLADLARADAEALDAVAGAHAFRLVRSWGPGRVVRTDQLDVLPEALASRVVRLVLARVRGDEHGLSAATVARVRALRPGQALDAGRAWVTAGGGWLAAVPVGVAGLPARDVAVPGTTPLPELGVDLHTDEPALAVAPDGPFASPPPGGAGPMWALLPPGARPFTVRARQAGDRIVLPGGTRKVQDVFVDAGVPRVLRDLVPLVVDAQGRVWWVAGVAAAKPDMEGGLRVWITSAS